MTKTLTQTETKRFKVSFVEPVTGRKSDKIVDGQKNDTEKTVWSRCLGELNQILSVVAL